MLQTKTAASELPSTADFFCYMQSDLLAGLKHCKLSVSLSGHQQHDVHQQGLGMRQGTHAVLSTLA